MLGHLGEGVVNGFIDVNYIVILFNTCYCSIFSFCRDDIPLEISPVGARFMIRRKQYFWSKTKHWGFGGAASNLEFRHF